MLNQQSWERDCLSKRRYRSLKFADEVALRRGTEDGIKLYTYRCPDCSFWHITKQEYSKTKRFKVLNVVRG